MISYDNKNWFSFLFQIRGSSYPGIFWGMITMGIITGLICLGDFTFHLFDIKISPHILSAISLVVGMLLVFRMNTAYDRWWEGRKLLGQLLNTSRFFCLKINNYIPENDIALRTKFENLIVAYAYALTEHLLKSSFDNTIKYIPEEAKTRFETSKHKPSFVLDLLSKEIYHLYQNQSIKGEQLIILENSIVVFTDIIGACERIKYTPIPFAYAMHLKRIIFVFCIFLPFSLVHDLGWVSVPIVMMVFYTLVGIEIIGEEIEDPFGEDNNDLPMWETVEKIKSNIVYIIKN